MQEEVCAVIEGAGLTVDQTHFYGGTPTPNNTAQLLAAIKVLRSNVFAAIVGAEAGCTHADLPTALADSAVPAGSRILVLDSYALTATIVISKANIEIHFAPGVTISKTSATKGISLNANGVRLKGGRIDGFSGGGDVAIQIETGINYCFISEMRFGTNTTDVNDIAGKSAMFGNINE